MSTALKRVTAQESIGITIALSELYRGVKFEPIKEDENDKRI
jgi:hypothetical protein